MTNSVIIGMGVVGKATAKSFGIKKYIDIKEIEGDYEKIGYKDASNCRYIFICLPSFVGNEGRYQLDRSCDI